MSSLKLGAKGTEVSEIQKALKDKGFYSGQIDGQFGPKTEMALKKFQSASKILVDGVAGIKTLQKLVQTPVSATSTVPPRERPLALRCLELTASIETSQPAPHCYAVINGNTDQMVMSFGALQWNFGQQTLQPILNDLINNRPALMKSIFGINFQTLQILLSRNHAELMNYFMVAQKDKSVWSQWVEQFRKLGYMTECIDAQFKAAQNRYETALKMCQDYGLVSEKAVALMFDIHVQNGSIDTQTRQNILQDFKNAKNELDKLIIIAHRRAAEAKAEWRRDVLIRKETIAKGTGSIHGRNYNLETDFGIGDNEATDLKKFSSKVA